METSMHKRTDQKSPSGGEPKLLLSVEEAAAMMSLGRTLVYALVRRGEIASFKVGKSRRIPVGALHTFILRYAENAEGELEQ
jgi:excisionase family DNA binding protein